METASLAQAIGQNSRRLRLDAGVTLEQLAAAATNYGLPWTSGRVGDFEGGRVAPTLPTLFAVALALRDVTGQSVTLAQLLQGSGDVALSDALAVPLESVRAAVSGHAVSTAPPQRVDLEVVIEEGPGMAIMEIAKLHMRESDYRLARDIGVAPESALETMARLWGQVFSAERDSRAGDGANAQRKGQISRQLKVELVNALQNTEGGNDGNG